MDTNPSPLAYPLVWVKHVTKNRTDSPTPFIPGAQLPTPRRPTQKRPPLANPVPAPPAEPQSYNPNESNPRLLKGDRQDEGTRR